MRENSQKKPYDTASYVLFDIWLLLLGILLLPGSFGMLRLAGQGPVRSFGIVLYGMLDILFMIIYATKNVYWMNKITYEQAQKVSAKERRRYARRQLFIFLACTILYFIYCFVPGIFQTYSTVQDSFVMSGILCMAVLAASRIRL